jgi:putative nicotinate phosphoribosyltransferase
MNAVPLRCSLLLTDLYQLTMLQAYFDAGMAKTAVFEFFVRRLPPERNFLVAAGLEQVLDFLEDARFSDEELAWLGNCGRFHREFAASLRDFRFSGEVQAMAEGTVFFPDEPILRVVAPMPQAQLVETRIINLLQYQTLVASKAARIRLAAPGRRLVDFGLRRAHGAEAAIWPVSTAPRRCWQAWNGECRCSAPWPTPSSRRTNGRSRRSSALPARTRRHRPCSSTPMTPRPPRNG